MSERTSAVGLSRLETTSFQEGRVKLELVAWGWLKKEKWWIGLMMASLLVAFLGDFVDTRRHCQWSGVLGMVF